MVFTKPAVMLKLKQLLLGDEIPSRYPFKPPKIESNIIQFSVFVRGDNSMQIQIEGTTNKTDVNYLILDIGGTLCKICVVEIKNNNISLWVTSLPSSNLAKIKEIVELEFKVINFNFDKIYVTGGGSYKFSDEIRLLFGNFSVFDEMESTVKGAFFSLNRIKNGPIEKPKFPIILANVGTGASFIFIDENMNFTRIGGTNIAGGTLQGIFSLSSQQNSSMNLSKCIENGNRNNVDVLVRDIYGKDYENVGLNGDIVAGSLAKIDKYAGNNRTGDICASSAFMICSNLIHLLYLYASAHDALSILFSGSFVTIPAISVLLKTIAVAKFSGKFESHIFDFGGYLGCFGIASELISEVTLKALKILPGNQGQMKPGDKSSLVSVLLELGSACCEPAILEDILTQILPTCKNLESQISQSLFMIVQNSVTDHAWNPEVFTEVVLRAFPKVKRAEIISEFDFPAFYLSDARVAEGLLKSWRILFPKFYEEFPFKIIFMKWNNVKGQLSLVYNLLLLGPDMINFGLFPAAKVISNEDLNLSTTATKNLLMSLSSQTWNCYEIYDLSCKLVDTEFFEDVRPVFELASRQCSELLCIALAMFNPSWNSILKEILVKLTCGFLLGQPSSAIVLPRIWNLNPNIMMLCMVEMHRRDSTCLSRLLDVSQDLKILTVVLEAKPYNFSLDMASLASRRQHLNLEKWLSDSIKEKGSTFFKAAIEFVLEKIKLQSQRSDRSNVQNFIPVSSEVLVVFSKVFQSSSSYGNSECQELLRIFYQALSSENPQSSLSSPTDGLGQVSLNEGSSYPQDIEDEVNAFFEKIFSKEYPVNDVIELLKRLRASNNARDQQLFSCMTQNLFDEYRFFSKYPENELILTATIFGAIIKHQLISHVPLGIGLRYVLEALKKPLNHKLFKFGINSLIQFQRRLLDWPQYCSHLLQIPHLCQAYPDLVPFLQAIISGTPIATLPFPEEEESRVREHAILNESTGVPSLETKISAPTPSDAIRDKILFVLNNISASNLEIKIGDLRKLLNVPIYTWFANYLVVKRAIIESNYHQLYVQMLECFGDDRLIDSVLKETFVAIEALLKSPKTGGSSTDRTLLKTLGMWLGALTLARDRPILHNHLNIKNLLIDAVLSNRLIVVIPFACKVLEQAMYSRVFRPFNPFTMGSIRLLVELYKYSDLKLNLKFEIEVLCKSLSLDIKDIKPSSILKDRNRLNRSAQPMSPSNAPGPLSSLPEHISIPLLNSLVNLLQINKINSPEYAFLLKIFPLAVEYAIRELSFSVSERSINIASVTGKAMISKDFSSRVDIKYSKSCALRLVQYLASSLALASLKESIRPAILSNLKTFLQISELPNPFSDSVWLGLIEENVENITSFIEQGTAERVVNDFDQIFSNEWINNDRSSIIEGPVSYDAYENIFNNRRYNRPSILPLNNIKAIVPGEYDQLVASLRHLTVQSPREDADLRPAPRAVVSEAQTVSEIMEVFIKLLSLIEKACQNVEDKNVSKLSPDNDVRKLMKQIIPLASGLPSHRDELCLLMCQRLMQLLYKNSNPLFSDVIILLLVKIFEFSAKVAKEVTTWIIYSDDDRKYNVLATWALFNSGLIYVLDYDAQMARQIEKSPEIALKFAIELIRKCVFEEPSVAAPYDFVYSLEALKNAYSKSSIEEIKVLLDDLAVKTRALSSKDAKNSHESVVFCFTDWFRLCQYPSISDKLVQSFMSQLFEYGFFQEESSAKIFFQVCTETAVEIYVRQRRSPAILAYRSIEAYSKLVARILERTSRNSSKSNYLSTWELLIIDLKIVGVILAQGLEQNMDYLQKPFSRFITCLLTEIGADSVLSQNKQITEIIGEFLLSMSPTKLPKFCFAWFEAICHPSFLSLFMKSVSSQELVLRCIIEVLNFLKPVADFNMFTEPAGVLFKGLLKLFAVVLHDNPELFVTHYLELCDHIPNRFVQLKNIVLAAVPRDVILPDPLSPGLKIDTLPGIRSKPEINSEYVLACLEDDSFVSLVDECLSQGTNPIPSTVNNIVSRLGPMKNCNAFVNLVSVRVSANINEFTFKAANALLFAVIISPAISAEARYNVLCAMANHLRFPNYLTYFFSFVNLHIFRQIGPMNDSIKSQIVRVLLERLVAYRPHPWGLMITFMELIRNPEYRFWNQSIVKSSPEIEKMFETVAKSCLVNVPAA